MRCPLCVEAGAEHELHIQNGRPEKGPPPAEYWDKLDQMHMHDAQKQLMHMRCSNGHSFTVTYLSKCPVRGCDWNNQPETGDGVGWPKVDDGAG